MYSTLIYRFNFRFKICLIFKAVLHKIDLKVH